MSIWRDVKGAESSSRQEPAILTIGNFDGVHRGHRRLLARAASIGHPLVAMTFDPHPARVLAPDLAPKMLTTVERRIELLKQHGADEVRVLAFDADIASWSPEEFIDRVLVGELQAKAVVVGENFRFGQRAAGTVETLKAVGADRGFDAEGIALDRPDGSSDAYCSSLVRDLIAAGQMPEAAAVLGRPHEVSGVVVRGDGRGKDLGFPTANVPVDDRFAVPPDGVYAGHIVVDGQRHDAAISVGTNPTFGGVGRRVESYVIEPSPDLDLYNREIRIEFVQRIRPMETFDTVAALVAQMHEDVAEARGILA